MIMIFGGEGRRGALGKSSPSAGGGFLDTVCLPITPTTATCTAERLEACSLLEFALAIYAVGLFAELTDVVAAKGLAVLQFAGGCSRDFYPGLLPDHLLLSFPIRLYDRVEYMLRVPEPD